MQQAEFSMTRGTAPCERNTHVPKKEQKTFFTLPKKITSFFLTVCSGLFLPQVCLATTAPQLWHEIAVPSRSEDSILNVLVERHRYLPFVKRAVLLETDAALLQEDKVSITVGGHSGTIRTLLGENTNSKSFIRYGELSDDRRDSQDPVANMGDVFFAVQGRLMVSKFYFEDEIYALIPIYKHYHLLLQLNAMRLPNECGTIHQFGATPPESPTSSDYRLRVLVAFSQVAISGLKYYSHTLTPEHFAQMAIGENNLAHWRNPKRTPHLNLEKVAVLSYSELEMKRDLANLTAERPPFDLLQRWRTEAATDLQILIRSSEDALFGMSRAEADGWSSGRAFCVMTLDGFGFTPYSLAHQIEHLRPDANEPNDNTIAPSVFQTRLTHKELSNYPNLVNLNSDREKSGAKLSDVNAHKTRFFARHSIFYAENRLSDLETDSEFVKTAAEQPDLLQYWDILPFIFWETDTLSNAMEFTRQEIGQNPEKKAFLQQKLPQTVEILESDHSPKEDEDFVLKKMELPDFRIMPNPTQGETFLEYRVPKDGLSLRLDLANLTGQFVARLAENTNHPAGRFTVRWDAGGMPSGVYVCTLRMGDKVQVLRLVVE
jgi:hypothetical protein